MNNCPKCGREMSMYYNPWCQVCDKPQRVVKYVLNLIKCLEHIEATNHRPGYYARMWELMHESFAGNDIYITWIYDSDEEHDLTDEQREDIQMFNETYEIGEGENILLEVSW